VSAMKDTAQYRLLDLEEYVPYALAKADLDNAVGEELWRRYGTQVAVDFPTVKTEHEWRLTPQGWVGYIVLSDDLHLRLKPKVELSNLFRMLEYAYRLKIHLADDLVQCASLEEFYERLALILARRVIDRGRKGFYRTYVGESDRLPFVRGQLDLRRLIQRPWDAQLECRYEEHTGDIADNQILAWTLHRVARSGLCSRRVLPTVRTAYRGVQAFVTPTPFDGAACAGRMYNRLNDDYEPLHALCRFFLEHSGPQHETGDRAMLPFLIDMNRLFELFVAEWLKAHLPKEYQLKAQEDVDITEDGYLQFRIDLVLYDAKLGEPLCVLDTKYKRPDAPSAGDIEQVVAYAVSKRCREAALIYPTTLSKPLDTVVGGHVHVQSLWFPLDGDLDGMGRDLIDALVRPGVVGVVERRES